MALVYAVGLGLMFLGLATHLTLRSAELERNLRAVEVQLELLHTFALAPPPPPPAPPSLDLYVSADDDDGDVIYPGVDSCNPFALPEGIVFRGPLDYGRTMCPAQRVMGSSVVEGALLVDELLLRLGDTVVNLTHFVVTQQLQSGAACVNPCAATGLRNTLTCDCVCLAGWTGADCATRQCLNGGTLSSGTCLCPSPYDPATNCATLDCGEHGRVDAATLASCICEPGFTGTPCVPETEPPTCTCAHGTCVGGACICGADGRLGPQCELQCVDPRLSHIQPEQCPVRSNWGEHVDCFDTGAEFACICGHGGFVYESDAMFVVGVLKCDYTDASLVECREQFASERAVCCAPGGRCSQLYRTSASCAPDDAACCAELTHLGSDYCRRSGCDWCGEYDLCVATDFTFAGCTQALPSSGLGDWTYYSFLTTDPALDTSNFAREQTLEAYSACQFAPLTSSCYAAADTALAQLPWPTLQLGEYMGDATAVPFTIAFPQAELVLAMERFSAGATEVIGVTAASTANGACPANAAPFSGAATQGAVADTTSYFLFVTSLPGTHHCLARPAQLAPSEQLIFFGTTSNLPDLALLPTLTQAGVFMDPALICEPFVLTTAAVYTEDGHGLAASNGAVTLQPFASAATLQT